jgi:phage tail sheath protein FI
MAFQVSPGVNVSEIDLTTIIPAVSSSTGAVAAHTKWGPVGQRVLVDNETTLVSNFGSPNTNTASDWFTASNFLSYGNSLYVVRAIRANTSTNDTLCARNATSNAANTKVLIVKNDRQYEELYSTNGLSGVGTFVARYPGELGNSIRVSVCPTSNGYESTLSGTATRGYVLGGTTLSAANNAGLSATVFTIITAANGFITSITANTKSKAASSNLISQINTDDYLIIGGSTQRRVSARAASNTSANLVSGWTVGITLALTSKSGGSNGTVGVTSTKYGWYSAGPYGTGTITFSNNSTTVTSTANVGSKLSVGDIILAGPDKTAVKVGSIAANGRVITLQSKYVGNTSTATLTNVTRRWEYFDNVPGAPGTSAVVSRNGGSNDEVHVVVVDEDGRFSGIANSILEVYPNLSKAAGATDEVGTNIFYKNYIQQNSKYVYWMAHPSGWTGAGSSYTSARNFGLGTQVVTNQSLYGGKDGNVPREADYINAYNLFKNAEEVDVSIVLGASSTATRSIHIINNICEYRKDCIAVLSPRQSDVVNNSGYAGSEAEDIISYRDSLPSSSYAIMDSGWKYQYDKYNDLYRYVPLNGDVAGTMVRTDLERDPWWSPAGFNRGQIKNVIRLAYSPNKTDRDQLYKKGINPIVTFPGEGTILYGDKTLLAKPSAFDRINVRRLFIVLEKAIATAAKYTLFEFNDAFTRAQFRSIVEPFLRDVQGRRGITDFRVVCDETNNTAEVIDRNEFVGDIYIKPARSINFIQLNFVAVRTGVDFSEVVGKF